ncbi:MAG: SBBP repeat-containing protein [Candidatus Hodarchaeota archaeon]
MNINISVENNLLTSEWYRIWGEYDSDTLGMAVAVDSFSNVYLAGYKVMAGVEDDDMVLVKYDENGIEQWNRSWGGNASDRCCGLALDLSGNILLVGSTESFGAGDEDIVLVKYNRSGTLQWNTTWGGGGFDRCYGGSVDSSENMYLVGVTDSFDLGGGDIALVKYDKNGEQQWNRTWGGIEHDAGRGITIDSLGNIYLVGQTESYGAGDHDIILVKYDENGLQQWNRTWGGISQDIGDDVVVDQSGNVYLVGQTWSFGPGQADIILVKYDLNGIQQWNRTWGGGNQDYGKGAAVDSSGNVYIAGETESLGAGGYDMVLVKYDANGLEHCYCTWGGADYDSGHGIAVNSSDIVYLAGYTRNFGTGRNNMVLVKFSPYIASTGIPSYNIFIIIGILSISSLFLIKKITVRKSS